MPTAHAAYEGYLDYEITHYQVDVTAHTNNTYDITETIDVRFNEYKHGIYRLIPLRYNDIRTKISGLDVYGESKKIIRRPSLYYIRLGDADTTIIGDKRYTISYSLNMGKDQGADVDAIYLDLIGNDWFTIIHQADFTIDVSEFGGTEMTVMGYAGFDGESYEDGVSFQRRGVMITGSTTRPLDPYEGVTLKADMAEGTMASATNPLDWVRIIAIGIPLAALIIVLSLRMRYRLGGKAVPVIAFYPPEGLNPAEVGYIIDERVDNEDVGAMIIYWASKGFLRIEEQKWGKFTLHKTGEPGVSHYKYEVEAFNKLFALGTGTSVKSSDLRNAYYTQVEKIKKGAMSPYKDGVSRLYTLESRRASNWALFLGAVVIFTIGVFIGALQ